MASRRPAFRTWTAMLPLVAAASGLGASACGATEVNGARAAVMDVGVPQGFDDIARAQKAVVDVIYGGVRIGQAGVEAEPGKLSILDVDALLGLIPDIVDRDAVRAALASAPLDTHASLICAPTAAPGTCPRLAPAVAGVVFDEDRFRLQLFINPRFLKVRSVTETAYLPRPDASLSLLDSVAGTIAGGSGGDTVFAIQNRAVLGVRDARLISTASYASGTGLVADVLAAQLDKPGVRYTAGLFWAPNIDLIGQRKLLGVGIETQLDTRFDKDVVRGSPLIVALSQRSRVDLLVNGRIVGSRTYEAGNQSIDTAALPEGAFEVVLHIQEISGASRDERRFFSKNSRIAPLGQTLWFAHGGVLANERDHAFISATNMAYFAGGVARRLNAHVAVDGTVVVTDGKAIGEIGGYVILPFAQLRLGVLGSSKRDTGVLLQLNSLGTSAFNYNLDLRRVYSHDDRPLVPTGQDGKNDTPNLLAGIGNAFAAAGTFTQIIADISYRLPNAQINCSGYFRRDARQQRSYGIGPTVRWSIFQKRGIDVTFEANVTQSNRGRTAFVGLRLQVLRAKSSFGATAGAQTIASDDQGKRSSVVAGLAGTWQDEDVLDGTLSLAGNLDHTPESDVAHARADMRGPYGMLAADAVKRLDSSGGQYSLGFSTTAIVSSQMVSVGGRDQSDSAIAVHVRDAPATSTFEVLVNETPRGIVHGGDTVPVSVTPYRQYSVRIRPLRGELVHFDGASRLVSVYPGNVARLAWSVKPVIAMFGRAVWPDGTPISDADVVAQDAVGHTDSNGYFQIETSPDAALTVRATDGTSCQLELNGIKKLAGYVALGTLICGNGRPFGRTELTAAN